MELLSGINTINRHSDYIFCLNRSNLKEERANKIEIHIVEQTDHQRLYTALVNSLGLVAHALRARYIAATRCKTYSSFKMLNYFSTLLYRKPKCNLL